MGHTIQRRLHRAGQIDGEMNRGVAGGEGCKWGRRGKKIEQESKNWHCLYNCHTAKMMGHIS